MAVHIRLRRTGTTQEAGLPRGGGRFARGARRALHRGHRALQPADQAADHQDRADKAAEWIKKGAQPVEHRRSMLLAQAAKAAAKAYGRAMAAGRPRRRGRGAAALRARRARCRCSRSRDRPEERFRAAARVRAVGARRPTGARPAASPPAASTGETVLVKMEGVDSPEAARRFAGRLLAVGAGGRAARARRAASTRGRWRARGSRRATAGASGSFVRRRRPGGAAALGRWPTRGGSTWSRRCPRSSWT